MMSHSLVSACEKGEGRGVKGKRDIFLRGRLEGTFSFSCSFIIIFSAFWVFVFF
jgi:hypothetical protein